MVESFFDVIEKRTQIIHYINLNCPYIKRAINNDCQKIDIQFDTSIQLIEGDKGNQTSIKVSLRHVLDNTQKAYSEQSTSKVSIEKALDNLEKTVKGRYVEVEKLSTPFETFVKSVQKLNNGLSKLNLKEQPGLYSGLDEMGFARPELSLDKDGQPVVEIYTMKYFFIRNKPIVRFRPLLSREPMLVDIGMWGRNSQNLEILSRLTSVIHEYTSSDINFMIKEFEHILPGFKDPF